MKGNYERSWLVPCNAVRIYAPRMNWRQVHVRTYAYRRGPAACRVRASAERRGPGVAWRGVGEDDEEEVEKDEGEEESVEEGGRGRNTSGEPLWKEDMMARGVMLRELLCSSGTTGP